jgi:tetratricopeptide (TPR) repeat protein
MNDAEHLVGSLRRPGVQITFALHVALAIVLAFVPLFDVLGFERAFATGLLSAGTSPVVAITLIRRARETGSQDLARIAAHAFLLNLLMLIPSLAAGFVIEAIDTPCNPEEGLLFLLLCPGGNAYFGTALGLFAGTCAHRRALPGILTALILAAFFGLAIYRLYSEPQIFVYSVPFGYWPGSIYDEELGVDSALLAFRAYTLFFGAFVVSVVRAFLDRSQMILDLARPRATAISGVVILGAATFGLHQSGERLGFDLTRATVERALSRRVVTDELEIFIDPSVRPAQVELILLDHRFRYRQLETFFDHRPRGRIRSFVYRDESQKRRLMGAGSTQIARPWANEIHIDGFDYPHRVLKHELAHVFAAEMAGGLFRVPATAVVLVNVGVVEGVAVAADWRSSELTVHGWSRAMRALQLAPDLRRTLDVAGFWSISSARAYTVAGSFIRHLIDEHGMDKLRTLYRTNDFAAAYGRSLDELVTSWEQYIDSLPLPEGDLLMAEHRFVQPGIFQKVCAHEAANLARDGYEKLGSGDIETALPDLLRVLELSPQDPTPLIAIAGAYAERGDFDRALAFAQRALTLEGVTQKSHATAREALANIQWRMEDSRGARDGFQEVLTLHLSTPSDRLQLARLASLDRPKELQAILREYLAGKMPASLAVVRIGDAARAHPIDGLLQYLYGKSLENAGAAPEAAEQLRRATALDLPGEPLVREAWLALGRTLLASDDAAEAERIFEATRRQSDDPSIALDAGDWAERARFAGEAVSTSTASPSKKE